MLEPRMAKSAVLLLLLLAPAATGLVDCSKWEAGDEYGCPEECKAYDTISGPGLMDLRGCAACTDGYNYPLQCMLCQAGRVYMLFDDFRQECLTNEALGCTAVRANPRQKSSKLLDGPCTACSSAGAALVWATARGADILNYRVWVNATRKAGAKAAAGAGAKGAAGVVSAAAALAQAPPQVLVPHVPKGAYNVPNAAAALAAAKAGQAAEAERQQRLRRLLAVKPKAVVIPNGTVVRITDLYIWAAHQLCLTCEELGCPGACTSGTGCTSCPTGSVLLNTRAPGNAKTFEGEIPNGWAYGYPQAAAPPLPSVCLRIVEDLSCKGDKAQTNIGCRACPKGKRLQRVQRRYVAGSASLQLQPVGKACYSGRLN